MRNLLRAVSLVGVAAAAAAALVVACGDDSSDTTPDDGGGSDVTAGDGGVEQDSGGVDAGGDDGGGSDAGDAGSDSAPCFVDAAGPYLVDALEVAAEGEGACALRQDHSVVCWGTNGHGQLGTNGPDAASFHLPPVPIAFPSDAGAIRIDHIYGGYDHVCALDSTKRVWCWGRNLESQLGNGAAPSDSSPVPSLVVDGTGQPLHAEGVAATFVSTCALLADGSISCWGNIGAFGDASAGAMYATPIGLTMSGAARQIEAHAFTTHFCAKDTTRVVCWGGAAPELGGVAPLNTGLSDQLADGGALVPIARIETGGHHTCAVDGRHDLYCWGQNIRGELGDASTTNNPTRMSNVPDGSVATVANGDAVTCYLDLTGHAYCFGFGGTAALGNGDDSGADKAAPQLVVSVDGGGSLPAASLSPGTFYGCARVPNGCGANGPSQVVCWGSGYGSSVPIALPSP